MHDTLSITDVVRALEARRGSRTWEQYAAEIGVGRAYLYQILTQRRAPNARVLDFLGLERTVTRVVAYRYANN